MNNKILITINKIDDIKKLKELGITKYAFPLKNFCVGMPNTFLISEIKEEGYLFINRILDNDSIIELKSILNDLPSNIRGIIFDDLGVYELIKDKKLESILYLNHFNTNSESINIYLNLVDSVIVSTDITEKEIDYIIKNANKRVVLFTFGYVPVMYSRRKLLDNYWQFHNIKTDNPLEITNESNKFLAFQNEYGTVFYNKKIFNGLSLNNKDALYYFWMVPFLNIDDIENVLNNNLNNLDYDDGFLNKSTIYKLKDDV